VTEALRKGVHLQLAHEFPSSVDDVYLNRHSCPFNDFFDGPNRTPRHLLVGESSIYNIIATALKPAAWRKAGLVVLALKLAALPGRHKGFVVPDPDPNDPAHQQWHQAHNVVNILRLSRPAKAGADDEVPMPVPPASEPNKERPPSARQPPSARVAAPVAAAQEARISEGCASNALSEGLRGYKDEVAGAQHDAASTITSSTKSSTAAAVGAEPWRMDPDEYAIRVSRSGRKGGRGMGRSVGNFMSEVSPEMRAWLSTEPSPDLKDGEVQV